MKKTISITLITLSIFLCACGNNNTKETGSVQSTPKYTADQVAGFWTGIKPNADDTYTKAWMFINDGTSVRQLVHFGKELSPSEIKWSLNNNGDAVVLHDGQGEPFSEYAILNLDAHTMILKLRSAQGQQFENGEIIHLTK